MQIFSSRDCELTFAKTDMSRLTLALYNITLHIGSGTASVEVGQAYLKISFGVIPLDFYLTE